MSKTRNGIYYDLTKSEYKETVKGITYVFSSLKHKEKFNEQLIRNRLKLTHSLFNRFKVWLVCCELADLILYGKLETRGFLIVIEGVDYKCLESLTLNGVKRIEKR